MASQVITDQPFISDYDLDPFSDYLEELGDSEKTINAYCSVIRGLARFFVNHTGQGFAPELVIAKDLRAYDRFSNQEQRVKASTWNLRFNALAVFFRFAIESKAIVSNPFDKAGLKPRRKQKEAPKSLNKNDFARVERVVDQQINLAHTNNQRRLAIRNKAMFGLMAYAGLRVGELCELRASDLLLSDRKGRVDVEHGKGDKEGSVPLGREARLSVSEWLEIVGDGPLFDGITERQVQRFCHDIGEQAGVMMTPHTLRHTFVYRVLENTGGNLSMAQELARHSKIDQTARYAMPHEEDKQRAVENL